MAERFGLRKDKVAVLKAELTICYGFVYGIYGFLGQRHSC